MAKQPAILQARKLATFCRRMCRAVSSGQALSNVFCLQWIFFIFEGLLEKTQGQGFYPRLGGETANNEKLASTLPIAWRIDQKCFIEHVRVTPLHYSRTKSAVRTWSMGKHGAKALGQSPRSVLLTEGELIANRIESRAERGNDSDENTESAPNEPRSSSCTNKADAQRKESSRDSSRNARQDSSRSSSRRKIARSVSTSALEQGGSRMDPTERQESKRRVKGKKGSDELRSTNHKRSKREENDPPRSRDNGSSKRSSVGRERPSSPKRRLGRSRSDRDLLRVEKSKSSDKRSNGLQHSNHSTKSTSGNSSERSNQKKRTLKKSDTGRRGKLDRTRSVSTLNISGGPAKSLGEVANRTRRSQSAIKTRTTDPLPDGAKQSGEKSTRKTERRSRSATRSLQSDASPTRAKSNRRSSRKEDDIGHNSNHSTGSSIEFRSTKSKSTQRKLSTTGSRKTGRSPCDKKRNRGTSQPAKSRASTKTREHDLTRDGATSRRSSSKSTNRSSARARGEDHEPFQDSKGRRRVSGNANGAQSRDEDIEIPRRSGREKTATPKRPRSGSTSQRSTSPDIKLDKSRNRRESNKSKRDESRAEQEVEYEIALAKVVARFAEYTESSAEDSEENAEGSKEIAETKSIIEVEAPASGKNSRTRNWNRSKVASSNLKRSGSVRQLNSTPRDQLRRDSSSRHLSDREGGNEKSSEDIETPAPENTRSEDDHSTGIQDQVDCSDNVADNDEDGSESLTGRPSGRSSKRQPDHTVSDDDTFSVSDHANIERNDKVADEPERIARRPSRRSSRRRGSFSSSRETPTRRGSNRGSLRRTVSEELNLLAYADAVDENGKEDHLLMTDESSWRGATSATVRRVKFREDVANSQGVACSFLENKIPLSEEDIEETWYTGHNYKDFRNFCIKEALAARENEEYTSRFKRVWALCDTESTSSSWQELLSAPHTKSSPNNAVMLAKARFRGFEREIFPQLLVRYRKFAIKYVVTQFNLLKSKDADDIELALREASEKCTEPFRRYARLIAEGDGLLVAAWEGSVPQNRRAYGRSLSGLSVASEGHMTVHETANPIEERRFLLNSLKSSGSCRNILGNKKEFDNPAMKSQVLEK